MLNKLPMAFSRELYPSHAASLVYNYSSLTKQRKRFQYYETEMKTGADGFLTRGEITEMRAIKRGFRRNLKLSNNTLEPFV